jgi:lipopolysaccharide transport system ATP-binding protein
MSTNDAIALRVERLGKRYSIGTARPRYRTLTEEIAGAVTRSLKREHAASQEFWALRNVSFELKRGEVLGVLGSNGAGKSTLLKLLSRITAPSEGSATLFGRLGSLLEIGTGFHPELSGRENVFLSGAILGMRREEIAAKFDAIVDFAEVEAFLDTPVKRYSSGMYVRLAFAVAAFLEPEILVVDEVLAVGDASFQKKCIGRLSEVSGRDGRTVLFVSHNMSAIHNICSRVLLLEHGEVAFDGATLQGIQRYLAGRNASCSTDLTDVKQGRRGDRQHFELLRLEVLDSTGMPCRVFAMGSPLVARLTLRCKKAWQEPRIGIMLTGMLDTLIHDFTSAFDGFFPNLEPGDYVIDVQVEAIKVYPGTYSLGAWVQKSLGIASDDYIRSVLTIEVIDAKQIGDSRADFDRISKASTEVYVPCQWSITKQ